MVGVSVAVGVGDSVAVGVGDSVAVGVGDSVAVGVGLAVSVELSVGIGRVVGVGVVVSVSIAADVAPAGVLSDPDDEQPATTAASDTEMPDKKSRLSIETPVRRNDHKATETDSRALLHVR